jgi:hypothetical protein
MEELKLTDVADPVFRVVLPDGSQRSWCPFKLQDALSQSGAGKDLSNADNADKIRGALGFPTEATAKSTGTFTPSIMQVMVIQTKLAEFLNYVLPALKKNGETTPS